MDPILGNPLPYIASAITVAAGIFAFFWARNGDRNEVGGIGWTALLLVVAGGVVAVLQTYSQGQRAQQARSDAAEAAAKADELSEELRRAQFANSAALLTLINGFDLTQPIDGATLIFNAAADGDRVVQPPGFVGPFPQLPRGASAELLFALHGSLFRELRIVSTPDGARVRDPHPEGGTFDIRRDGTGYRQGSDGFETEAVPNGIWLGHTDLGLPFDDVLEPSRSNPVYTLPLRVADGAQFRTLVTQLVRQRNYGSVRVNIPQITQEQITRILAGYASLAPDIIVPVPTASRRPASEETCHTSLLRIPLQIRERSRDRNGVTLEIVSNLRGFQSEPCLDS